MLPDGSLSDKLAGVNSLLVVVEFDVEAALRRQLAVAAVYDRRRRS